MAEREHDIYTICTCYSLDILKEQRDNYGEESSKPVYDFEQNEIIYTAPLDVLEVAIACYDEGIYHKVKGEMKKERKQYGIRG